MAEYIDRDRFADKIREHLRCSNKGSVTEAAYAAILQDLEGLPAAEVATVVHGRWEWHGPCRDSNGKFWGTCSVCKVRQRLGDYGRFCPYCGAKMDGGEKANE